MSHPKVAAVLVALAFLFCLRASLAADADKCKDALVIATYNKFDAQHLDWRLATLVTEGQWDQISHSAGVNAVIYGVPVGASYSDFHSNAMQKLDSHEESLTQDQFENILWTGLDPNSPSAYKTCIESQIFQSDGLHMAVKAATASDVTVMVAWHPVRSDPKRITPSWDWDGKGTLPHTINAGVTTARVVRPSQQKQLVINFNGASDSVTIDPAAIVSVAPPPPPNAPLVVKGVPIPIDFQGKNRGQVPGCACGDLAITFPGNPFAAKVFEPFRFRYDASSMCRGQGFDRFHGNISWDGNQSTNMGNANNGTWPGIAGTVVTTFSKAGDYNVAAYISVDCLDNGCRNTCTANGVAQVHISDH
jgi:hypothetical protein